MAANGFDEDDGNLDHSRLYVTNIPKEVTPKGLQNMFNKFGELTEFFVNSDPKKRFGLLKFKTPSEARLAMMKLNRSEPMRLNISIAKKSSAPIKSNMVTGDRPQRAERRQPRSVDYDEEAYVDDSMSDGSRGRHNAR